jgi:hypothetical protein
LSKVPALQIPSLLAASRRGGQSSSSVQLRRASDALLRVEFSKRPNPEELPEMNQVRFDQPSPNTG